MNRRLYSLLPLLLAFAAQSCGGDDTTGPQTLDVQYFDTNVFDVPVETTEDAGEERDTFKKDYGSQADHLYEIIFLHDTSAPQGVQVGATFTIHVKVIDFGINAPADGQEVFFEIATVTDLSGTPVSSWDGSLSSQYVYTDDSGVAHLTFNSKKSADRIYRIMASIPDTDTEPKTVDIMVYSVPLGCIEVALDYEGGIPESSLHDIEIFLLPSYYPCSQLFPEKAIPVDYIADRMLASYYGTTSFDSLPSNTRYTLFARSKGPDSACIAASGCYEGVFVEAGSQCADATIKLYLTTMNPAGQYDCIDHFDFTEMVKQCAGGDTSLLECATGVTDLGQTVCCVLSEMIKFFETPGETIFESVMDLARQFVGSVFVDIIDGIFHDAVSNWLTAWLKNSSPDWLQDFFNIGEDMMGAITNLEMMSDMVLAKIQNDFTVQGTQFWHGLALYWKFGCETCHYECAASDLVCKAEEEQCEADYEACGRIPLDLEQLSDDPAFPMNILEGKFTASIADFDRFIMNQHAIKLNYGKLVLYVLNYIVIPTLTDDRAHSLKEVAYLWIDCQWFGDSVFGDISELFGGDKQDVIDTCYNTVDFLFGFLDSFLGGLTLDTELSIAGDGRLVDEDCDLRVDKIIDGTYLGYVQGNTSQASITGDFVATKK